MPELPEVETVVRSLRPYVVGKQILRVEVRHPKSFPDIACEDKIVRREILAVRRRAKLIIFDFEGDWHLVTHLKMTGQLLFRSSGELAGGGHPTADVLQQLPGKHTRVILTLTDSGTLYFNDLRIFGWMRIMDESQLAATLAVFGPDAVAEIDAAAMWERWRRVCRPIKQVLMDNKYLCGIGNIYAAEVCFACGLDPAKAACELTLAQVKTVLATGREILARAIEFGGTTFDGRYVDANGQGGNFEGQLQVYGRAGEACTRCGTTLQNLKIGGRSTVFCPRCQR